MHANIFFGKKAFIPFRHLFIHSVQSFWEQNFVPTICKNNYSSLESIIEIFWQFSSSFVRPSGGLGRPTWLLLYTGLISENLKFLTIPGRWVAGESRTWRQKFCDKWMSDNQLDDNHTAGIVVQVFSFPGNFCCWNDREVF